jgi:cytochrome c biogenesis protein CcmG/thiol:disulfide interchange protein DsbE
MTAFACAHTPVRVVAALAASALLLSACSDEATVPSGSEPTVGIRSGAGALADNAAQADTIIGSGKQAFEARIAALKGHPVVVNQWASWCESCRFEFPFFRAATAKYGDRVAFLGLDSHDERGAAEAFQRELPSGFPSVFDQDAEIARDLGGGTAWPTTFFFDSDGALVHTKVGAYATPELLEQDIQRHALRRERS